MAEKGILALTGIRPPDEDEGGGESDDGEGTAEARAIAEMFAAHDRGDDEAAGRAFKRAYRICAASKGTEKAPETEEDTEDEYEG